MVIAVATEFECSNHSLLRCLPYASANKTTIFIIATFHFASTDTLLIHHHPSHALISQQMLSTNLIVIITNSAAISLIWSWWWNQRAIMMVAMVMVTIKLVESIAYGIRVRLWLWQICRFKVVVNSEGALIMVAEMMVLVATESKRVKGDDSSRVPNGNENEKRRMGGMRRRL